MKYELLLNLAIYVILILAVVMAVRRILDIIGRIMGDKGNDVEHRRNYQSKPNGHRKGSPDTVDGQESTERKQIIAEAEAVRREMQRKIVTRYAGEDPEKTAKILKTLLVEKEDKKK